MYNVKACLFDLDGVIVDTAKYHYLAWNRLANELGFTFSEEQNERLKGVSRMRSLEILLEAGGLEFSPDVKEQLAQKKNAWYIEYISRMNASELLPGAREFLADLRAVGIKTALGSASKNAMMILKNIGLIESFDSIVDGNRVSMAKPDPEVFLLGAFDLSVEPQSCVVFEDADAGVQAAKRAGMHCVGIGSPKYLSDADFVVKSLAEMSVERLRF